MSTKHTWTREEILNHAKQQAGNMLPHLSVVELDEDAESAAESAFAFWVKEEGTDAPDTLADDQRDEWANAVIEAIADAIRKSQAERVKATLSSVVDVIVENDGGWLRAANVAPDSKGETTEPGSAWDKACNALLAEVRGALPDGWTAEWSDDDILVARRES